MSLNLVKFLQFMRPRSRDKKLNEEWAVPLKNVEDIYEVRSSVPAYVSLKV